MDVLLMPGDALRVLGELNSSSVDSLVTDPPAGISFMEKSWDSDKGGRDKWIADMAAIYAECLRVLKPGAHGLVWAIPRTSHWTATALEDAGFEIKDCISHIYGSGFPKNRNISKELGQGGQQGLGTALKPAYERWLMVRKPLPDVTDLITLEIASLCRLLHASNANDHSTSNLAESRAECDSVHQSVATIRTTLSGERFAPMAMSISPDAASTFLSIVTSWNSILDGSSILPSTFTIRTMIDLITALRTLRYSILSSMERNTPPSVIPASGNRLSADIVSSVLNENAAKLVSILMLFVPENAGSIAGSNALSPGALLKDIREGLTGDSMDIVLIRKPISEKTIAKNVLKHGTGAINIDKSRIGEMDSGGRWPANVVLSHTDDCTLAGVTTAGSGRAKKGEGSRPGGFANVGADKGSNKPCGQVYGEETVDVYDCADDCPVRILDEQSGASKSPAQVTRGGKRGLEFGMGRQEAVPCYGDVGGASRFFYVAKPSAKEKNAGLEDREARNVNDGRETRIDNPFQRGDTKRLNVHPTVKAVRLMSYLCNLVTPPGGTIIDPFMGSGTTGIAAVQNGFSFIGIDNEAEYVDIARKRIEQAQSLEKAA